MLTHLDLFSGIGGFALASQMIGGIKTLQFVEVEPYCQKVLAKNFPGVPIHGDITTFVAPSGRYDLVTAGWPCQDISNCNPNGQGLAGKRSRLFFEVVRLIRQCRPRYVLLENVPALLSKHNGRDMGTVLWELFQSGYDVEWQFVSAAQMGAPHLRERVFIVGYSHSLRCRRQGMEQYPGTLFSQGGQTKSGADTNSNSERLAEWDGSQLASWTQPSLDGRNWWSVEPPICRVAPRISNRVDRLKGLGNAVVPQVAAIPLSRILEIEAKQTCPSD